MKYFFDNNLSIRIASAIRELEDRDNNTVMHLKHMFKQDTSDVEWMTALGDEGSWIVVTSDRNIVRNPHERLAWIESGLTIFFIKDNFKNFPFWDQAWHLIKRWPEIKKESEKHPNSCLFLMNLTGTKIEKLN